MPRLAHWRISHCISFGPCCSAQLLHALELLPNCSFAGVHTSVLLIPFSAQVTGLCTPSQSFRLRETAPPRWLLATGCSYRHGKAGKHSQTQVVTCFSLNILSSATQREVALRSQSSYHTPYAYLVPHWGFRFSLIPHWFPGQSSA